MPCPNSQAVEIFLSQFWPNFAGTVIGGTALSFIFFFLKEWLFSLPRISGLWEAELITEETTHPPYRGMKLWYRITLIQNGATIKGIGEIDKEESAKGSHSYKNKGKRPIELTGFVEKRILRSDTVQIMWSEQGESRKFSNVFILKISGSKVSGNLRGTYASTAANSKGNSFWKRDL